jgi:hypothetical protein
MTETTILRIAALVGVVAVFGILSSANTRDEQRAQSVAKYEACVEEQYNTTPAHYRLDHGEYPVCDTK